MSIRLRSVVVLDCMASFHRHFAINPLVYVNRLAPWGKPDRIHSLDGQLYAAVQLSIEVVENPFTVLVAKTVRHDNAKYSAARGVLAELELSHVQESVVVHVQCGPRNFRTIMGNERLLRTVASNVANDRVLAATGIAAVAHIARVVAGRPTTDQGGRAPPT